MSPSDISFLPPIWISVRITTTGTDVLETLNWDQVSCCSHHLSIGHHKLQCLALPEPYLSCYLSPGSECLQQSWFFFFRCIYLARPMTSMSTSETNWRPRNSRHTSLTRGPACGLCCHCQGQPKDIERRIGASFFLLLGWRVCAETCLVYRTISLN